MRLLTVSAGFLVFAFFPGFAQRFDFGAKLAGTLNGSEGQGTNQFVSTAVYGASIGGFATYFAFPKIKLRAEVLLSTRGFKSQSTSFGGTRIGFGTPPTLGLPASQSSSDGVGSYSLSKRTVYIDVPVGADYEILPNVILQGGGMVSFFVRDNTGKYTLKVASYANFPGINIVVGHYTDSHTWLTSLNTLGSAKITLKSFNPTTYATTTSDFYKSTTNWIYRASISKDGGTESGISSSIDQDEFYYIDGYQNTSSFENDARPGVTLNRNIFFFATVPAL